MYCPCVPDFHNPDFNKISFHAYMERLHLELWAGRIVLSSKEYDELIQEVLQKYRNRKDKYYV